jgi:tRNA dimethylallyltransferase
LANPPAGLPAGGLVSIFGPTGVGKSEVAEALAGLLAERGPVGVSADAIAIYEGLDVLAAKPLSGPLEYRLVSCVPIDEEFSAGRYAQLAHAEIDGLVEEERTPIVVGGTGLYLRAALTDLDLRPPPEPDLRARLEQELAEVGPASLHGRLSTATAQAVHPNDRKRIVRALELELMGRQPHARSDELWSEQLRRPTALFGLTMERGALLERIRGRAAAMLSGGAIEEVELALERGASRTARKALGFKEIAAYLEGDIGLDEARERIERGHVAYVKRQLTWMKKLAGVEVIDRTTLTAAEAAARISGD